MHHRSQCFGYCSFSLIMFPGTTLRKRWDFQQLDEAFLPSSDRRRRHKVFKPELHVAVALLPLLKSQGGIACSTTIRITSLEGFPVPHRYLIHQPTDGVAKLESIQKFIPPKEQENRFFLLIWMKASKRVGENKSQSRASVPRGTKSFTEKKGRKCREPSRRRSRRNRPDDNHEIFLSEVRWCASVFDTSHWKGGDFPTSPSNETEQLIKHLMERIS
ncbi:hypothetical protein CEXT_813411 [Caerostris extrusa]|uniref:Uncharacterized protein n=1 Tax=Caerostris extrusa TaxID=172846 RepID=A0AAV4XH81_CAEEX|nr:hypothetical protein CEXT_813411 [Caerostris extrusa]